MNETLFKVRTAPKGMGLNEFVAEKEGYFERNGLAIEFDWKILRDMQLSWKGMDYFERPQDKPYAEGEDVIQSACEWGSICNASAGMGTFVANAYGVSPWAIFVRPDSPIEKPEDLKDVPVAVGMRAGSHFNVPYRLEEYLPLEHIKTENVGGFGARLQALLDGDVDAASLLPPQIDMAEQLGLRKIMANTFCTLWWVPASTPPDVVTGYLDSLQMAEEALNADLDKYLPLWELSVPEEFKDRSWDYSRFSRGERFVYEDFPRAQYERIFEQVKRWDLAQYLKDENFENISFAANG